MTLNQTTCPSCGAPVTVQTLFCAQCGTRLSLSDTSDTPPPTDETRLPENPRPPAAHAGPSVRFEPGAAFSFRYRILHRLGEGGMGVVYQAWDAELGIPVALKVIRPEALTGADGGEHMERRFKRELVLARQVTHKHVVRIHDLGEFGGVKYLTMPFIEGRNLAKVLSLEGTLPVARALRIGRQVAEGLAAAHDVGVIHRDLKPENIMIDADDSAMIMDFGLARSSTRTTLTRAGALVGTMAYMSPEQARGEAVDQRADMYSWGLLVYDMLAGKRRLGRSGDAMSDLIARMQQPPPDVRSLEPRVPAGLDRIVMRCVETDRERRFATTRDLIAALDTLDAEGHAKTRASKTRERSPASPSSRKLIYLAAAVALLLAVAAAIWGLQRRRDAPATVSGAPVSVLIADFQNHTGDPVFSGAVEDALSLGIEGASFITVFPRREAERAAQQIRPGATLDEEIARLVCRREGIRTMLAGSIATQGNGFRVSIRAIDPVPGTVLAEASEQARDRADVLETVGVLSDRLRQALGDATPASAMSAERETFTAASLESARDYAQAQDLANANRDEDAIALYERAIAADPRLGRAYAGRAQSAYKLGRTAEAEDYYKKAFALVDRMTEREKFRTLGTYYLNIAGNYDLAIENYEALLKKYPSDGAAHNNLALAYFNRLEFSKALDQGRQLLAIYPSSALYRYNQALYAMYAGDFSTAEQEGRAALSINAMLPKAHLAIAMAALAGNRVHEARAAYERARNAGARGASLAAIGLADLAMHQGRFDDAAKMLPQGIEADLESKNTAGAAAKAVALAEAEQARGDTAAAFAAIDRARMLANDPSVLVPAAQVLLKAGRTADVTRIADQLATSLAPRPRAYSRVVRAMLLLEQQRVPDAVELLEDAQKLADLWLVRFYKGLAYSAAGAHAEALREFEACLNRRGEATAVFLDDVPTYRHIVVVSYWLGRTHEALGAHETARRHFRDYVALRSPETDALARDAVQRME
jgi:eukaryotic-like serine/threonine-protein kinase